MGWEQVFGSKPHPCSYGKYRLFRSPDRRHAVVFDPGCEVAMGWYAYDCRLITAGKAVLETFRGLSFPVQSAWWTPDSRIVGLPVSDRQECLLLIEVERMRYSLIFFNAHQLLAEMGSKEVRILVDPAQFRELFGRRFRMPKPLSFRFSSLDWRPIPGWELGPAIRKTPPLRWRPAPSAKMRAYARKLGLTLPRDRGASRGSSLR